MAKQVDLKRWPVYSIRVAASDSQIGWFLLLAVLVHALGLGWYASQPERKLAELPDWINIKISTAIEETSEAAPVKQSAVVKKQPAPRAVALPPEERHPHTEKNVQENAEQEQQHEKNVAAASRPFVQADSRPFDITNPKPVYPGNARKRGMQGTVLLQAHISAEGRVTTLHIMKSSGYRILDQSAMNSIKRWRFMPAQKDGVAVASTVQVPVRYLLAEKN